MFEPKILRGAIFLNKRAGPAPHRGRGQEQVIYKFLAEGEEIEVPAGDLYMSPDFDPQPTQSYTIEVDGWWWRTDRKKQNKVVT